MWASFKTTLVGLGVGFINLYAGGMTAKNAALSVGLALLGALSKDFDATGGTKPVTPEAVKRIEP